MGEYKPDKTSGAMSFKSCLKVSSAGLNDFALVFILVCLSGNMFFLADGRDAILYTVFALMLMLAIALRSSTIHKRFLLVAIVFTIIFVGQAISLSLIPVITIAGFFMKLVIAYGVLRLVADFPKTFVYVMAFVSVVSFLFYIPERILSLFNVDPRHLFLPLSEFMNVTVSGANERIHIGIYNFQTGENASRNAAFFWEPGAFAGYLILAVVFLSICKERFTSVVTKSFLSLFTIALLTTQSTMGIVVLPFALLLFIELRFSTPISKRNSMIVILTAGFLLIAFAISASKLDFVGEKIVRLYSMGVNQDAGWQASRFGAMIFDAAYIQVHPLTGWGQNMETQFQLNEDMDRFALGNGMTGFVRQMGLLGMGVFLYASWLGFRSCRQAKGKTSLIVFVVLLALNGEYFLLYPLFMSLMFLGLGKSGREPVLRNGYA
ncbi:hypothetical protein Ga0123461_1239 [Mariprofundus aestuarium]|uniref:O-antigen ligase like membrane protein n=2 Tax=Mariprofundus aestuarium TaxID=1921086 RepID=A0A2K8KXK1_MARES|nr:hypothetical protein Ga0123461_1239 [Mariprofundus aestuarium]